ncbi:MAG TPA: addiction module protein [Chitinophagales bacterium]|nr:addiction module protein [Chitinophagales bacterium]
MKYLREILDLPLDERIHLVETIWDSIALESDSLKVPQWQVDETIKRMELLQKNPENQLTLEEFRQRLQAKLKK